MGLVFIATWLVALFHFNGIEFRALNRIYALKLNIEVTTCFFMLYCLKKFGAYCGPVWGKKGHVWSKGGHVYA